MGWEERAAAMIDDAFPRIWLLDDVLTLAAFGSGLEGDAAALPVDYDTLPTLREAARIENPRVLALELFAVLRLEAGARRDKILQHEPIGTTGRQDPLDATVADLLFDLCSDRAERRVGAVDELYLMRPEHLQDGLVRSLEEAAGGVRWLAAQCLAALEVELVLPDLRHMAASDDPETRILAHCALSHLATPEDVDVFISGLWERDELRLASLRGLGRLIALAPDQVARKAIEPLTFLAGDNAGPVRRRSAELLGELALRSPLLALRKALPVLKRGARRLPWKTRETAADAEVRAACREAADRIHQATRHSKSLPLPVEITTRGEKSLPRPSDAGAGQS